MKSEFIKELEPTVRGGSVCLIKLNDKYYRVSTLKAAFDTGAPETLIFPSDEEGQVTSWGEVAGGKYVSREEAIEELENNGENEGCSGLATIESALNAVLNPPGKDYYIN